ncbi:DUF3703 domain-containing protein [Pseudomonas sp. BN102]|uniref:DUF3703 domain-containing protein n=1 Tax=Pseudomonas sp. BN102 TaxID=2567886 RepID=UPI002454DA48|nr:DUF3703 domain-containing protein [Pseudomonas sp. BN102]MDH4608501.1 DUF3703 domain-containing protein [Pseudomonas sp. BN102]
MKPALRIALDQAFEQAVDALANRDPQLAYPWLERAHILSQCLPLPHTRSHWLMLLAGWQQRDFREVLGHALRIPAALLFSRLWVPLGNTGRARVSAFKTMPLPEELRRLLD